MFEKIHQGDVKDKRNSFEFKFFLLLTYRNSHISGHCLILKRNHHYLSHFAGKVLLKFCLFRHKTHSIVSPKCANLKLKEYNF